jgi:hypothetical protein
MSKGNMGEFLDTRKLFVPREETSSRHVFHWGNVITLRLNAVATAKKTIIRWCEVNKYKTKKPLPRIFEKSSGGALTLYQLFFF